MSYNRIPFRLLGIAPFRRPNVALTLAVGRAGGLGVLELGRSREAARLACAELTRRWDGRFGVLLRPDVSLAALDIPADTVVVLPGPPFSGEQGRGHPLLAQVTSTEEARAAVEAGVDGLIAKGVEAGGRVGRDTSFILLQRLVTELELPIWVRGGVGLHTAAACVAGGAAGVVLDSQLALVREAELPPEIAQAVAGMDGSETVILSGHRIFSRPDLEAAMPDGADADEVERRLGSDDLTRQLLPAGPDAALARPLADRFATAGGVATAVLRSVKDSLISARSEPCLAPGSPLAIDHGIEYPIFQGPMTRVSDTAAFADAVSGAGALPFLALSMLRGDAVRELLLETRQRVGDRAWGVGILGFVPPELRDEQLAAIQEVKPSVALIAGGRPSQARPLEAEGIATYLHVPSPGLLDLFLKEGARRLVFEGRECGGHVGPRTSLVLWEAQLQRLMSYERPEELSIVFAGGIHDARSAAMVAAMAAPLARRGAKIGVLMGTAYLFTQEAVDHGAVLPAYQKAALDCDSTVLLETAPGHATRCVGTPYVDQFLAERGRLERAQLDPKEVWARLEMINLGRLRIASKGLKREGERMLDVDEADQRRDGMYMIGDVATLRGRVVTAAELHREISEGAGDHLRSLTLEDDERPAASPVNVAIVGMACIFAGADDLDGYWSNIIKGVDSITEVDPSRWNPEHYYDPASRGGDRTPTKRGGFISDVVFDPLRYGIPPQSLTAIDPTQLLSLDVARRALEHAGYGTREFDRSRVSVVFGAESGADLSAAYGFRALYRQYAGELPQALDEHLPRLTEDSFPGVLANVIAGRIANRLDLGGGNFTVDAACASSLASVDVAVKELVTGSADMVLCGGADLHNGINDYLLFANVHALSRTGCCRTFDAESDGIVLGEGVACVVLKRLADAERDGDKVYAVIKSVAASSDGRSLGLTAPRKDGQKVALRRAYEKAGISPKEIGLIEAHATGTVVGDRTELAALTETFSAAGAGPGGCGLGSVKAQIGHTKCAAGLAGVIKVAMALHRRILPPTINIDVPNPGYEPATSPFALSSAARPWVDEPRTAAVSAFGFGGSNFHAVLTAHDEPGVPESGFSDWPAELFLFRGEDRDEAVAEVERLRGLLAADVSVDLRDLAASVGRDRTKAVQIACVAGDRRELRELLDAAVNGAPSQGPLFFRRPVGGKVAFLFPGQGSQRPGMLRELFVAFPRLHGLLKLGARYREIMLPPTAWTSDQRRAQKERITDTRVAQPALGLADLAMADLLEAVGVRPDMAAGHSYGELVALCLAGAFTPADLLKLSEVRARSILEAAGDEPGEMAAVSAERGTVAELIDGVDGVVVANANAPEQTVISGSPSALDEALARFEAAGTAARRIPVACAFHSPIVAAAAGRLRDYLNTVDVETPEFPVWSNTTAELYPADPDGIREMLARHVAEPVEFARQVRAMYEDGARLFVEVGPGRVLAGLVDKILAERPHETVTCDSGSDSGLRDHLEALGRLAAAGLEIDTAPLFADRGAKPVDLTRPEELRPAATSWKINGWRAHPVSGPAPKNGLKPTPTPVVSGAALPSGGDIHDSIVIEYLRNLRELATSQRDVMLGYLGAELPPSVRVTEAAPDSPIAPGEARDAPPDDVAPAGPPVERSEAELGEMLLTIVSERTGYPREMLGLEMDLEAELSIDSIKRVEILGALASRLGLDQGSDEERDYIIEQLASRKTLGDIIAWLLDSRQRAAGGAGAETTKGTDARGIADFPLRRYVLEVQEAPLEERDESLVAGKHFALTDGQHELAGHLRALLERAGARVTALECGAPLGKVDGVVYLGGLRGTNGFEPAKDLFEVVQQAVGGEATTVIGVTASGGKFGRHAGSACADAATGISGLLKSLAKERPELRIRIVDTDPRDEAESVARAVFAELTATDRALEVGYQRGVRFVLDLVPTNLLEPAGDSFGLDADSVVLVTGGGRGITAATVVELARRTRCRLELVGRTPLPAEEDLDLAAGEDLPTLRKLLIERRGMDEPKSVEAECRRILVARELRSTLAAIREAGASVSYHTVDVRDAEAFGRLIDEIYERQGRIDLVLHGAGIIDDKLVAQKTSESFARVYDTKVTAARTLVRKLRDDVRGVVFFSSVSGVFGNRGQTDYAAAGDALDKMALELTRRIEGRVLSIDWGPWGGTGMVSEALADEYARRGVGLIPLEQGVDSLIRELADGPPYEGQVLLMAAEPQALAER